MASSLASAGMSGLILATAFLSVLTIAHLQTFPFGSFAIRGNVRAVDVVVALFFKEFDGEFFYGGFGDFSCSHPYSP